MGDGWLLIHERQESRVATLGAISRRIQLMPFSSYV
jgi:hypothetical protein